MAMSGQIQRLARELRSDALSIPGIERLSRRTFLSWLGWGNLVVSGLLSLLGGLRYLLPNVMYPPVVFKIGRPEDYPEDSKTFLREEKLFIIREKDGFHAMSAICTHLGCSVNTVDWGYRCLCHGSKFDNRGVNFAGPAPKPLPFFKMYLASDGQLLVDSSKIVSRETILKVPLAG